MNNNPKFINPDAHVDCSIDIEKGFLLSETDTGSASTTGDVSKSAASSSADESNTNDALPGQVSISLSLSSILMGQTSTF